MKKWKINENFNIEIAYKLIGEIHSLIKYLEHSGECLEREYLIDIYKSLKRRAGGDIEAYSVIINLIDNDKMSLTVRSFLGVLITQVPNRKRIPQEEREYIKGRLENLLKKEEIPIIKLGIAVSYANWGYSSESIEEIRKLIEYYKNSTETTDLAREYLMDIESKLKN